MLGSPHGGNMFHADSFAHVLFDKALVGAQLLVGAAGRSLVGASCGSLVGASCGSLVGASCGSFVGASWGFGHLLLL
jgi:hypothetical protein